MKLAAGIASRRRIAAASPAARTGLGALCLLLSSFAAVGAAGYEMLGVESVFSAPPAIGTIASHGIVLGSSRQRIVRLPANTRDALKSEFVYQTRVRVNDKDYFRLAVGNFADAGAAREALRRFKPGFPQAWVYARSADEQRQLAAFLDATLRRPDAPRSAPAVAARAAVRPALPQRPQSPADALRAAREALLDRDYPRAAAYAGQAAAGGNLEEMREALELEAIAREREGRFDLAIALYEALLDTAPGADVSMRIESRLEGLRTMRVAPRKPLPVPRDTAGSWRFGGTLHQYYWRDEIEVADLDEDFGNEFLSTHVNLDLSRNGDRDTIRSRIDATLLSDLDDDRSESRVSRADLSYATRDYEIIGGRQYRAVTGAPGRFDGFTYRHFVFGHYRLSYFFGTPVTLSADIPDDDQPMVGANLDFAPRDWLDISLFWVYREVAMLTDRHAIGAEFQLRDNAGYLHGLLDYDLFYDEFANLSLVSGYRLDTAWHLDFSLASYYSPPLATVNALYGQTTESVDDLRDGFSEDQVYQLARDRSRRTNSLQLGASYQTGIASQLDLWLGLISSAAAPASAGVDRLAESTETLLAADYSAPGLLALGGRDTLGLHFSDSESSEILSLRWRNRRKLSDTAAITPRLRLDRREGKATGVDQTIFKPGVRFTWRWNRNLRLEAQLDLEYSDLDLPELERQTAISAYLGYLYAF